MQYETQTNYECNTNTQIMSNNTALWNALYELWMPSNCVFYCDLWSTDAVLQRLCRINRSYIIQLLLACSLFVIICVQIYVWWCLLYNSDITKLRTELFNYYYKYKTGYLGENNF